jgi:Dolichyl-phosphate-mannose-protein mannosyltransferase
MPESTRSQKAALLAGVTIGVYFFLYTRLSLLARFTHDDLMNCWGVVFRPLSQTVTDCFWFFRYAPTFRPLGALVYRAAFAVSGFNLLPLRIVLLVLLGLTLVLFYCFVKRLSFSREAGVLAALLASYHLDFWPFYFNTGQLYDILCCFFYFSALVYYLRIRQSGRPLRWYETLIFCGLYLLTLDSKELGVSLPVVIGVWELLFNFPALRRAGLLRWARRDLLPVWVTGIMTAAYIAGRIMAPEGLQQVGGYQMNVSFPAYLEGAGHRLGLLFYAGSYFDAKKTGGFLLVLLLIAVVARSRKLGVCWILFAVGILPMAFIAPRGLAASWIPTVGLLAYAAIAAVALRNALLKLMRRMSWQPAAQIVLFLLAVGFMVKVHDSMEYVYTAIQPQYDSIENVRRSFRELCPTVRKDSRMLIVTDPFGDNYSVLFLVQLLYGDPTVQVHQLFRFNPKPDAAALASYDYVFDFKDGKLIRLDPAAYAKAQTGL